MRARELFWVLTKTAIFTALVPFTVGFWLPTRVHWAYAPPTYRQSYLLRQLVIGRLLFIAGAAISLWCAWDFSVQGLGTPAPIDAPKKLVVNGLYRYVRNPMYAGVFFLVASRAVIFRSFPIVVYLALVAICVNPFILFYEEPHLRKVFGEPYLHYGRRVPRWIPRFRPMP